MSREGRVEPDLPAAGEAGRDAGAYLAEARSRWYVRRTLLEAFAPGHDSVARCERALYACIQAAAADPPARPPGDGEDEVFTWLAAHLAGDAVPAAARERVAEKGLEAPAADALVLFPCPAAEAWLRELFHERPAERGAVVEIWRGQGRPPGEAPVSPEALLDQHGEAVMAWHAGHPHSDGDLLARHYRAPAAGVGTPGLAAAIEGGLLRREPAAAAALEAALHEAGPGAPPPLLDLAALAGLEHALPVLHQAALEEGGGAWLRLAWLGTPAVLEPLLEAMCDPRHAGDAARAWGLGGRYVELEPVEVDYVSDEATGGVRRIVLRYMVPEAVKEALHEWSEVLFVARVRTRAVAGDDREVPAVTSDGELRYLGRREGAAHGQVMVDGGGSAQVMPVGASAVWGEGRRVGTLAELGRPGYWKGET